MTQRRRLATHRLVHVSYQQPFAVGIATLPTNAGPKVCASSSEGR